MSAGPPPAGRAASFAVFLVASGFTPTLPPVSPSPCPPLSRFEPFHTTHWSVVLGAGEGGDSESAHAALAQLCHAYWAPLYGVIRRRGHSLHDAQDLTQGFFAHLIEHRAYARAEQRKGRFRAFLLAALRNFLADARDHQQALKRGGDCSFLPFNDEQAAAVEARFQTCHGTPFAITEDQQFERQWAQTLVGTALARLEEEYRNDGRAMLFDALAAFVKGSASALPTYEALARRLGIPAATLRSHVGRLRERYREILRAEVRQTVDRPEAVDEELRDLRRVLTAR